jgi:WD40 repeat protein
MAYSPASGILAVAEYGGSGRLHLFRPPASQPEYTYEDFRGEFDAYTRKAEISPDGRWLAYPGPENTVQVVDLTSRTRRFTLTGMVWRVNALAFSKDSTQLAAGGSDGTLMVWSLASGTPVLGPFLAHSAAITRVEFSYDGKTVLTTAAAGGLRLWNAINGRSMISIPEAESTPAPLVAEGDRAVVFWNLKTGDSERHSAPPLSSFAPSKR